MDKEQITMWVARDKDRTLALFKKKPSKVSSKIWSTNCLTLLPSHLFPSIKWEDDEPTKVVLTLKKHKDGNKP